MSDEIEALRQRVAELEAERDALQRARQWQPIETAPRDRKLLLGRWDATEGVPEFGVPARPTHLWWAVRGEWSWRWNRWWDGVEPSGLADPNVWCELPDPPSEGQP